MKFAKRIQRPESISTVSGTPKIAQSDGMIGLFNERSWIRLANRLRSRAGGGRKVSSHWLKLASAASTHRDQK